MMSRWTLTVAVASALAVRPEVRLPDGTPVEVRLLGVIASDISAPGEPVQLEVAADVAVDKMVVIKKGTPVAGAIVEAIPSQLSRRPARLVFTIRQTSSVTGQTIRLRTSPDKSGEQRVGITRLRNALLLWAADGDTFRAFVVIIRCPRHRPSRPYRVRTFSRMRM
jgi:hypothetical protein